MSSRWYFTRDGKVRGPFTSKQLYQLARSGQLTPTNLVWKKGSRKWKLASSVRGLFSSFSKEQTEESDQPHETRRRMFRLTLAIMGVLILLSSLILLASLDRETQTAIGILLLVLFVFAGIVSVIAMPILLLNGYNSSCPECRKWWARGFIGEQVIKRKKCYGLVTRRAYTRSSGSVSGAGHHWGQTDYQTFSGNSYSSGSTTWQERVPVIRTTYQLIYECKHCRFRWDKKEVDEVEDFDIER